MIVFLFLQGGYRGFYARNTQTLNPKVVNDIHKRGGTILGTSRGGHDTMKIVDSIEDRDINQVRENATLQIFWNMYPIRGSMTLFSTHLVMRLASHQNFSSSSLFCRCILLVEMVHIEGQISSTRHAFSLMSICFFGEIVDKFILHSAQVPNPTVNDYMELTLGSNSCWADVCGLCCVGDQKAWSEGGCCMHSKNNWQRHWCTMHLSSLLYVVIIISCNCSHATLAAFQHPFFLWVFTICTSSCKDHQSGRYQSG